MGFVARIRRATKSIALGIVAIDLLAYKLLFAVGFYVILFTSYGITLGFFPGNAMSTSLTYIVQDFTQVPQFIQDRWRFILFWAGFAPSIWMWLYVLALFVTRGLLRSEKLVNGLRYFLDVEKAPFRSIGAVAATLVFIVSVAIILVSVEVSRISAAS